MAKTLMLIIIDGKVEGLITVAIGLSREAFHIIKQNFEAGFCKKVIQNIKRVNRHDILWNGSDFFVVGFGHKTMDGSSSSFGRNDACHS
jgi:hypothetical protein